MVAKEVQTDPYKTQVVIQRRITNYRAGVDMPNPISDTDNPKP